MYNLVLMKPKFQCLLEIRGNTVDPRLRSGAQEIPRGNTKAKQVYETDPSKFPLYEPVPKLESLPQTSGK